jgi:hypothetical protein
MLSENERQLVWLRHAAGMQATGVQTSGSAPAHQDLSYLSVLSRLSVRWLCPHCTGTGFEHWLLS